MEKNILDANQTKHRLRSNFYCMWAPGVLEKRTALLSRAMIGTPWVENYSVENRTAFLSSDPIELIKLVMFILCSVAKINSWLEETFIKENLKHSLDTWGHMIWQVVITTIWSGNCRSEGKLVLHLSFWVSSFMISLPSNTNKWDTLFFRVGMVHVLHMQNDVCTAPLQIFQSWNSFNSPTTSLQPCWGCRMLEIFTMPILTHYFPHFGSYISMQFGN